MAKFIVSLFLLFIGVYLLLPIAFEFKKRTNETLSELRSHPEWSRHQLRDTAKSHLVFMVSHASKALWGFACLVLGAIIQEIPND